MTVWLVSDRPERHPASYPRVLVSIAMCVSSCVCIVAPPPLR